MSTEQQLAETLEKTLGVVNQLANEVAQLRDHHMVTQANLIALKGVFVVFAKLADGPGLGGAIKLLCNHSFGPEDEKMTQARDELLAQLTS